MNLSLKNLGVNTQFWAIRPMMWQKQLQILSMPRFLVQISLILPVIYKKEVKTWHIRLIVYTLPRTLVILRGMKRHFLLNATIFLSCLAITPSA